MRFSFQRLLATAALASLAACSDSATDPQPAARLSPTNNPVHDFTPNRFWGFRTTTFELGSKGGSYDFGDGFYTLNVPPNAVCDLSSSYGPGTWDLPCTALAAGQSIKVTATYGFGKNGAVIDFSPDLRFSPNATVTLSTDLYAPVLTAFRSYYSANPSALRNFGIYYTTDFGATGTSDAVFDQSLVTHIDLRSGLVWRRVKHFSGYNLATGKACEPSPDDPDCVPLPAPQVDQP